MTVRTGFTSSAHGFPFPNWFPPGSPVVLVPTPFGTLTFGDANAGLCGGMVYAALDLFVYGQPRPATPTPPVFRYFCKRLLESWNLPFGVLKYYDGQRRPGASRMLGDLRLVDGLTRQTVLDEWPKIRDLLDTGRPAPLGLVKVASFDPRQLVKNHQVLAHGYTLSSDGNRVALHVYDPNYPDDDTTTLTLRLDDPDAAVPVAHSCEGETVRGLFLSGYARPPEPPPW